MPCAALEHGQDRRHKGTGMMFYLLDVHLRRFQKHFATQFF